MPAAAIEDTWCRIPASISFASSTAFRVPPTLSFMFVSASAVMS
jgi:hypothetical protein